MAEALGSQHGSNESRSRKSKRNKKSFLQRAKKFGKRGRFGGDDLDKDTYDYFVRVLESLNKGDFEDAEAEAMFVHNVFEQTINAEVRLSSHPFVSRVLEKLLPKANKSPLRRFMEAMSSNLRIPCTNSFASHVLETLMRIAAFGAPHDTSSAHEDVKDSGFEEFRKSWLTRVCKFTINNLEEFMADRLASHVLRTSFQCLGGVPVAESILRSRRSRSHELATKEEVQGPRESRPADPAWVEILRGVNERVYHLSDPKDLVATDVAAGVLQALLVVQARVVPEAYKSLCRFLLKEVLPPTLDDEALASEPLCRTLEVLISNSDEACAQVLSDIEQRYVTGNMLRLATHPTANFIVQKALLSCRDKDQFESWYENELEQNVEEILASGNTGVVVGVVTAARRLSAKQSRVLVALMKSFHCYDNDNPAVRDKIVPAILRMKPREDLRDGATDVHVSGSLVVQELLHFNKPVKIVNSLLSVPAPSLRQVLCDPKGTFIADEFVKSQTIGEKSRDALVKALKDEFVTMSCSKHGSLALVSIWEKSSLKMKELMAAELVAKEDVMSSDKFGKFVTAKCGLRLFKRSRPEWRTEMGREAKKRQIFSDILGSVAQDQRGKRPCRDSDLRSHPEESTPQQPGKKAKVKAASYLDDL